MGAHQAPALKVHSLFAMVLKNYTLMMTMNLGTYTDKLEANPNHCYIYGSQIFLLLQIFSVLHANNWKLLCFHAFTLMFVYFLTTGCLLLHSLLQFHTISCFRSLQIILDPDIRSQY